MAWKVRVSSCYLDRRVVSEEEEGWVGGLWRRVKVSELTSGRRR